MKILAYGEDSLTLWALQNRLSYILEKLGDRSGSDDCLVFYRPSFGRGGRGKANFGEFDFILLTGEAVYLGESKWDNLRGHVTPSTFKLKPVQIRRHEIMKFYIEEWASVQYLDWSEFEELGITQPELIEYRKSIAPAGTLLQANLEHILGEIRRRYGSEPKIHNVFLFLHRRVAADKIPAQAIGDFRVISIDSSEHLDGNFITL